MKRTVLHREKALKILREVLLSLWLSTDLHANDRKFPKAGKSSQNNSQGSHSARRSSCPEPKWRDPIIYWLKFSEGSFFHDGTKLSFLKRLF